MPFNVGPLELVIVLVIALLVIGPKRLPEMGNSLGKTIREFRKASTDITEADVDGAGDQAGRPAGDGESRRCPGLDRARGRTGSDPG